MSIQNIQVLYKNCVTCSVYFAEFRSDKMRVSRRSIVISQSSGLAKYAQTDLFLLGYTAGIIVGLGVFFFLNM
jgi:hypothetical protein